MKSVTVQGDCNSFFASIVLCMGCARGGGSCPLCPCHPSSSTAEILTLLKCPHIITEHLRIKKNMPFADQSILIFYGEGLEMGRAHPQTPHQTMSSFGA